MKNQKLHTAVFCTVVRKTKAGRMDYMHFRFRLTGSPLCTCIFRENTLLALTEYFP